jgi:hypothetical protein
MKSARESPEGAALNFTLINTLGFVPFVTVTGMEPELITGRGF